MTLRRNGTPQAQAGGCRPPYTLFVRAMNGNAKALRNKVEHLQQIERAYLAHAAKVRREIDELEWQLDGVLAMADQTNDEMHQVVVQQPREWIAVLRRFIWREPTSGQKETALSGSTPSAA